VHTPIGGTLLYAVTRTMPISTSNTTHLPLINDQSLREQSCLSGLRVCKNLRESLIINASWYIYIYMWAKGKHSKSGTGRPKQFWRHTVTKELTNIRKTWGGDELITNNRVWSC